MFKKEKLDQADEGLPPLDFPLDQFDLALFFKSDLSKITVELDDSGNPTSTSPIQYGTYNYVITNIPVTEAELVRHIFENTDKIHEFRNIVLTSENNGEEVTPHGFFTTCFNKSMLITDTLYTDSFLGTIELFQPEEINACLGQWMYLTFTVDGGG